MSKKSNLGAVQWKILIERAPENVRVMMFKYMEELRLVLNSYPTPGMCLLGENVDYNLVIPDIIHNINVLRSKMAEVDLVLETSNSTLAAYLEEIQKVNPTEEQISSGDIPLDTEVLESQQPTVEVLKDEFTAKVN